MGTSCNMCRQDVRFEQIDLNVPQKSLDTLAKFGKGSVARRKYQKLMITNYNEVAALKKPIYPADGREEIVFVDPPLIDMAELDAFMNAEQGGKNLKWITSFQPIKDNYYSQTQATDEFGNKATAGKTYKGQWKLQGLANSVEQAQSMRKTDADGKVQKLAKREDKTDVALNEQCIWEGIGIIQFPDGSTYHGQTKNGQFNGKGRMTHANGDVYQGEWKDGKANGQGVFVDTNGSMYEGEWLDDQQHGFGTESWNYNKIKFTGDFVHGKKTGRGRFEFEGGFYEGDFVDGQFHGVGKYYFADTGKLYEGEFRLNNMEGKGVMVWPDQARYEGEFKNGKMEGKGTKIFASGNKYIGQWKNDLQHGTGVFFSVKDQTKRQGEWQNGKRYSWIASPQSTHVSKVGATGTGAGTSAVLSAVGGSSVVGSPNKRDTLS